jgi:hypothetical protein
MLWWHLTSAQYPAVGSGHPISWGGCYLYLPSIAASYTAQALAGCREHSIKISQFIVAFKSTIGLTVITFEPIQIRAVHCFKTLHCIAQQVHLRSQAR